MRSSRAAAPRAARPKAKPVDRRAELAAIHIRAAELKLIIPARAGFPKHDDEYRALVRTFSNNATDSSANLDHTQRAKLLAHLNKLASALNASGPPAQWYKLRELWRELFALERVEADTEAALNTWCERQMSGPAGRRIGATPKSSARWYDNAEYEKLIEAAKRWIARD